MSKPFTVSAPGKVILFGEHAVVYGKMALAASLNLRTKANVKRIDGRVVFRLPHAAFECSWPEEEIREILLQKPTNEGTEISGLEIRSDFLDVLKKHVRIDEKNAGFVNESQLVFLALYCAVTSYEKSDPLFLDFEMDSELPAGGGLGSSASFSVCIVTAMLHLFGRIVPNVESGKDIALSEDELSLINQWAYVGETVFHGRASGIDNSISTYGGALKYKNRNLTPLTSKLNLRILLVNTKVPRKTKHLVARVQKLHEQYPTVTTPLFDAIDAIAERGCATLIELANDAKEEHYQILEKLISMNQSLLQALDVSHPDLNKIHGIASEHGLHSKLTGAGGGGCAFVLLPQANASVEDFEIQLRTFGFECWQTTVGGAGVRFRCFE